MFLLAGAFCAVTAWLQGGVIPTNMVRPFWERIANALFAYVAYLGQLFYPRGLAVFYPHWEVNLPVWAVVVASSLVLACISAGALASWRRYPYLLIGWLWYVGMLVPVIGLVQIGGQAMADRYTYLPQIGVCIALVWFAADVCRAWPYRRWVCGMASALVLALLMGCAWRQTSFWSCSETLWTHALACTSRNHVAHSLLGTALADRGQFDGAMAQYQEALKIKPNFDSAHLALGGALAGRGQIDEAMAHYRKVLETHPDNAEAHIALANALAGRGQIDEAIAHYRKVLEIQPAHADAHYNLAVLLAGCGRFDEAIAQYRQSLEINPDSAFDVHSNLGIVLAAQGRFRRGRRSVWHCARNTAQPCRHPLQPGQRLGTHGPACRGHDAISAVAETPAGQPGSAEEFWPGCAQPARGRRSETAPRPSSLPSGQISLAGASVRTSWIRWRPPMPKPGGFRRPWQPPAKPCS